MESNTKPQHSNTEVEEEIEDDTDNNSVIAKKETELLECTEVTECIEYDAEYFYEMKEKLIDHEFVNKIKNEILQVYPKIVSKVRSENFTKFLKILNKQNITFKVDFTVEIIQKNYLESLNEQFLKAWTTRDMPYNLTQVEILKKMYKNRKQPQWRPTHKSVAEQTLTIRCEMLQMKKKYLLKLWETQKTNLESLVDKVEKNRNHIKNLMMKREELVYKMDVNSEKLVELKTILTNLQLKVLETLDIEN